ncbi:MAG: NAD(+)/NADH kinase [Lachnospiraceae bacterium]|nr:NAD(+)/NADH kinase [Lachnospiraceae bacterium]
MRHFCMIANVTREGVQEAAQEAQRYLEERGCICRPFSGWSPKGEQRILTKEEVGGDTECILVLGGDGTLIHVCRNLHTRYPVYGIKLGTLGYLMETDQNGMYQALDCLVSDQYFIEERMLLKGEVLRGDQVLFEDSAMNDIVLNRNGHVNIIRFNMYVNGEWICRYVADGMITATPTGSTAYNLSAGGPIVSPEADLFIVTPICANALSARSIVLPADAVIELEIDATFRSHETVRQGCNASVYFDGDSYQELQPGDRVRITRSLDKAQLVKTKKQSFLDALRRKLVD